MIIVHFLLLNKKLIVEIIISQHRKKRTKRKVAQREREKTHIVEARKEVRK